MKIEELYHIFKQSTGLSTDTRTLSKGNIFIALKGEKFNANTFIQEALDKGALAVVAQAPHIIDRRIIQVNDSLDTLQQLARYHRMQLDIPIIALTGSNGKTTTKELLHRVLSTRYRVQATEGNLNNHIGVPLTLLKLQNNTEIAVVEMGANHPGEIWDLCQIAHPNLGYITNFGKAHLEGFGSEEGVVKAKSELYQYLSQTGGMAFINSDIRQKELTTQMKVLDITGDIHLLEANPYVSVKLQGELIQSRLVGKYNYDNIAAAAGIGLYFKIPVLQIKNAIESYIPDNKRSQLIDKGTVKIILDAYNANPTSMRLALESFEEHPAPKKAVILGDMLELGSYSESEHKAIADWAVNHFDKVVLIGQLFYHTKVSAEKYRDFEEFKKHFNKNLWQHYHVLIKASRGMALERITELF